MRSVVLKIGDRFLVSIGQQGVIHRTWRPATARLFEENSIDLKRMIRRLRRLGIYKPTPVPVQFAGRAFDVPPEEKRAA